MFNPLLAALIAWALAALQLPGMSPSPAPEDINLFVRGVLEDRFLVEGYPEQGMFGDSKPIDIQREIDDTFFVLGPGALPRVPGLAFRLRDQADLERDTASSTNGVHFVKVNRPTLLSRDAGLLDLEMGFSAPTGSIALCCCSKEGEFRRVDGRWRLRDWIGMVCR